MINCSRGGYRLVLLIVSFITVLPACKDPDNESGSLEAALSSTDETQIRTSGKLPENATNPDGGIVDKQVKKLAPEENLGRIEKNKTQPIIFGKSVSNITMGTTLDTARTVLSSPLGIDGDTYYYAEHLRVIWTANDKGKLLPELIFIDLGYLGALQLPEAYGEVKIGTSLAKYFPDTDPYGQAFIKDLARYFDGKEASYDCLDLRKCGIQLLSTHIRFIFQNGDLFFRRNEGRTLDIVDFVPPPPAETVPLTDPVIFGTGAAGITFADSRTIVLNKLGAPISVDVFGIHQYDNSNVELAFDPSTEALKSISLMIGYQGAVTLPASFGTLKLGDSLAAHFPAEDQFGDEFIMSLGRYFDGKTADPTYDCRKVNSCFFQQSLDSWFFSFDLGEIVISAGAEKRLQMIILVPPGLARTAPISMAATFPTGLGALTMADLKATYEAEVGVPRSSFQSGENLFYVYDNENLYIAYDTDDSAKMIQIGPNYQGAVAFPVAYGTVKMGDNFKAQFPPEDIGGEEFIKELAIFYRGEAGGYDCLTVVPNTCSVQSDLSYIYFIFDGLGRFIFDGLNNDLLYVIFDENQVVPTN